MFESFGRGLKMIGASIRMAWQDKRLLLPSILTVLTNIFFGILVVWLGMQKVSHAPAPTPHALPFGVPAAQAGHTMHHPGMGDLLGHTMNGPFDPTAVGSAVGGMVTNENVLLFGSIMFLWWLCNRIFEGVTTALVYSHLTEGPGSGRFTDAFGAVLSSLPAIIVLGMVTFFAKKIAGWLRNSKGTGLFGFAFSFLAGVVEIFWTLAGHLILPAIVIEGTSFWGGLKRADKIAQGNLLTIGVGEVGVEGICRLTQGLLYAGGVAGFGAAWAMQTSITSPIVLGMTLGWAFCVVAATAVSLYLRASFYSCLYVWAINAEAVEEAERVQVMPPAPLAAALA